MNIYSLESFIQQGGSVRLSRHRNGVICWLTPPCAVGGPDICGTADVAALAIQVALHRYHRELEQLEVENVA